MTETPDAHMVETLRLRTAALHRVSRSNDQLRRENDDLRARLTRVEALADQWDSNGRGYGTPNPSWTFVTRVLRATLVGKP